jgi:predicted transcriptional regulator
MPRPSKTLQKIRDKSLVKSLVKHGGNTTLVAKERGVSQQAICQAVKRPGVQKTITEWLDKVGASDLKVAKAIDAGLEAKKKDKADHTVRHRYVETALKLRGHLKQEDSGPKITWIQILNEIQNIETASFADTINSLESHIKNQLP